MNREKSPGFCGGFVEEVQKRTKEGECIMEILGVIAAFFILYELIKTKNELVDLNETVKELKKQLERKG
jgi:hypothetical protein